MASTSERFSLRLAPEHLKLLKDEATRQGKSASALASGIVIRSLTNVESDELRSELDQVRKDIRRMREDIATLGLVLLVKAGNEDPAKAEAWVRKNLGP